MVITNDVPLPKEMKWATAYARKSDHPHHRLGAVLVGNGGGLHAGGFNKTRTHPRSPHKFCIHAEVDVLIRERMPVDNYKMFVVRLTKGGNIGTSKPCDKCMVLIREAGIESVTYIDEFGKIKKENL